MATKNVELPEIGEGVNEGELVGWLVKVGDTIAVDQAVAELMTDKATVEVPSPISGVVKELKFKEGDTIEVGKTLIVVDTDGAATKAAPAPKSPTVPVQTSSPVAVSAPVAATQAVSIQPPPADIHVLATPSTRRLARETQVDINQIQGSGLAGRVTREDVLSVRGAGAVSAGLPSTAPTQPKMWTPAVNTMTGGEERIPLKGIRKKIAENLQMAKRVIPHFTLMDEANVTSLIALRNEIKPVAEKMGLKITYMPFVMKALVATIREFPKFNGMIDDAAQEIVYKKYFNIGFAADTPNGLLVPVIKNADQKTIYQLSHEIVDLATKARDGKLSLEEMKGATFTITNIGSVGGTYATPIINHPEVMIFGMYKIQERPVIKNGELDVASYMNFTVTCDHRLIDGAEAARFLAAFIARIESPARLMMDMV